ncbi:hypothetical protein WDU94_006410, partial [Cyamophila willieti]
FFQIRPCEIYKRELKGCIGFQGRFYQYFVDGELKDCSEWQRDFANCEKWFEENNYKSAEAVILNEEARIQKRMTGHYQNNVWEHRESPPEDWNKPLPDWMEKDNENTYLYHRAKEIKTGEEEKKPDSFFCSIM